MAETPGGAGTGLTGAALAANAAYQAGFRGRDLLYMVAIAMGESRGNPRAHNDNAKTGDNSYGLWQINMLGGMGPERRRAFGISSNSALFDPYVNAKAAKKVHSWQGFGAWSVYSSGDFESWMGTAASAIRSIGQTSIDSSTRTMGNDSSRPVLRRGSKGSAVRRLQKFLGIKVDGDFGPQTQGAVRAYQRRNKLKVDGIVGPETWGHLYRADSSGRSTGGGAGGSGGGGQWVMPVAGGSYSNDWGGPRSGGRGHEGTDIFAPRGTPIRAPVNGKIKTSMYGDSKGMGGNRVWLEGEDGYDYYFAHMNGMPTVRPGQQVSAGTMVGRVGDSGNAKGTSPHLHLGIRRRGSSEWINPYDFLEGSVRGPTLASQGTGGDDFMALDIGQTAEELAHQMYGAEAKFWLQHNEVGPIIRKAAEQGWDSGRIEGAISRTKWWRRTSQTQRAWEALQRTDPRTARQQRNQMRRVIERAAETAGVDIGGGRRNELARKAIIYGWSDQDIVEYVVAESKWRGRSNLDGQIAEEWDWIKARAAEMGVTVAAKWAHRNAKDIVSGSGTRDGIDAHVRKMALSKYPWLKPEIESGMTVREYAEPYIQQTADLLERSPTEFALKDKDVQRMLEFRNPQGDKRAMTLSEAADYVRSKDAWKGTDQARQQYAQVAEQLAGFFGTRT